MKYLLLVILCIYSLQGFAQEVEVQIHTKDITIAGSYTKAEQEKSDTLVILLSGSGAQDRESIVVGNPVFTNLSKALNQNGYSTYRFDDRGTGKSSGSFIDTGLDEFVDDLSSIMNYFSQSEDYPYSSFILAGHSLGGVISIKIASVDPRVTGLLLLASPALPLNEVINEQIRRTQRAMGRSEEQLNETLSLQEKIYEAVKDSTKWNEVKQLFGEVVKEQLAQLPESALKQITDVDAFIEMQFNFTIKQQIDNKQMESILFYDPLQDLQHLSIPIAIILGGKDVQVGLKKNLEAYNQICEAVPLDCKVSINENMNHLFQEANTGDIQEYSNLPKALSEAFKSSLKASLVFISK